MSDHQPRLRVSVEGVCLRHPRYYAPGTAVFTPLDPFEGSASRPMSLNGYSWVLSNPIDNTDPSGLDPFSLVDEAAALLVIAGVAVATAGIYGIQNQGDYAGFDPVSATIGTFSEASNTADLIVQLSAGAARRGAHDARQWWRNRRGRNEVPPPPPGLDNIPWDELADQCSEWIEGIIGAFSDSSAGSAAGSQASAEIISAIAEGDYADPDSGDCYEILHEQEPPFYDVIPETVLKSCLPPAKNTLDAIRSDGASPGFVSPTLDDQPYLNTNGLLEAMGQGLQYREYTIAPINPTSGNPRGAYRIVTAGAATRDASQYDMMWYPLHYRLFKLILENM